jgi:hypothetical protein
MAWNAHCDNYDKYESQLTTALGGGKLTFWIGG